MATALPKELVVFLTELAQNNNKEWMDAHRTDYEKFVKKPWNAFLTDLLKAIGVADPDFPPQKPAQVSFRIARDVRFSNDKTPYKPHLSAFFGYKGRKAEYPGMYVQLEPKGIFIAGGLYNINPKMLLELRHFITEEAESFKALLADPLFAAYNGLRGERNKVLPKELKDYAEAIPELYNKQFYVERTLPGNLLTSPEPANRLVEEYLLQAPLNAWLRRALDAISG
jgi:uncharacterized protein (TIGR02453 family)